MQVIVESLLLVIQSTITNNEPTLYFGYCEYCEYCKYCKYSIVSIVSLVSLVSIVGLYFCLEVLLDIYSALMSYVIMNVNCDLK